MYADCKYEEGDDFVTNGKYLWADRCKIHAVVEKVNKKCTKVTVGKITGAFGISINDTCRYSGGKTSAG